ncbi:hypothetical protein AVEN_188899-1 [Araneus ventricosus]|uniref:Uncharacterized protein n=1 Tax=Araneus ventricosus TaxID=182803 RepID=A0A4Y2P1S1_ARAVE|nr:hypothetical protein AVEN_188899-1 [Araneus ventricosus]
MVHACLHVYWSRRRGYANRKRMVHTCLLVSERGSANRRECMHVLNVYWSQEERDPANRREWFILVCSVGEEEDLLTEEEFHACLLESEQRIY